MIHTIAGQFEVTNTSVKNLSTKIKSVDVQSDKVIIELNKKLTEADDKKISEFLDSKTKDVKKKY